MAKAERQSSTWILLRAAHALVVSVYQSKALSEQRLVEWLHSGQVRWRCLEIIGHKGERDPGAGDPRFWQKEIPGEPITGQRQIIHVLDINWYESSAQRKVSPVLAYSAIRIEVSRNDILKLLPPQAVTAVSTAATVVWIKNTFEQMQMRGKLPTGPRAIAKQVHKEMQAAVRSGEIDRLVSVGHVENTLRKLDLIKSSK